uniref:Putative DNA repair and transcription factor protein n=1 Tax=Trypanosoma vivax (strain Y486) TaxID=1055687 RepID=G0U1Q2_TRYVY|nr:putative DNA repair and transcription factor protein, fragment [Trypanosoma vivax Y486]
MLRTVLLVDGSEAVNCSADYLPTRLLALRPQLHAFVHTYFDENPLAALGVVVMRDGVAHRICSCTTNATDILQALEVKYFLFGGSGAMSLENGLRLALSELVELKRIAKRLRQDGVDTGNGSNGSRGPTLEQPSARLRIVVISSSVTLVDPHDVFAVQRLVARLRVRVDVISFSGAVHALEEAAAVTGGMLHTPLGYDHLTTILRRLAAPDKMAARREGEKSPMIRIGFPLHMESAEAEVERRRFIACPQCGLVQTATPSTCHLCKLLICSVPLMHCTFIAHNDLCAPSHKMKRGRHVAMQQLPLQAMRLMRGVCKGFSRSLPNVCGISMLTHVLWGAVGNGVVHPAAQWSAQVA